MKHKFLFSVFVIFFILVFIALGSWQIIRLNWKNNLILEIENSLKNSPVELAQSNKENYLKIKTSGSIDFDKQIYLYNLNDTGTPGFEVINPILIDNENYLINRGWIPFEKKDSQEINFFDSYNCGLSIFFLVKSKAASAEGIAVIEKNAGEPVTRTNLRGELIWVNKFLK